MEYNVANGQRLELTASEEALLALVDFEMGRRTPDPEEARKTLDAATQLFQLLMARKAIPEQRLRYFTDPEYCINGHGASREQIFRRNCMYGDILHHPDFLKYLWYFLHGPSLPQPIINGFCFEVEKCGDITTGDIHPLGIYAKQQIRRHGLDKKKGAEEFYKLAIECGLDSDDARSIRDIVRG